jgi:hypothetical protein
MAIKQHIDYKKNRVRKNIHNYFYDNLLYTQLIYSYLILFFIDRRQAGERPTKGMPTTNSRGIVRIFAYGGHI